ncbi:MAG: PIN domain nuclease [Chloroflexi bacterium]|nr:PIN domain nuclease [Chloroflexota bacterium]
MVADMIARLVGGAFLATGGWRLGEYISDTWGAELYVPFVFGLTAAGIALGLIATPFVFRRAVRAVSSQFEGVPTSRMLSGILGLVVGLLAALLLSIPLSRLPGWAGVGLPIVLSIFLAYLGTYLMSSPKRDVFHKFITEESREAFGLRNGHVNGSNSRSTILVDTSAIIDGRIADIGQTGFIFGKLVIPQFVLDELRHIADSSDSQRRNRGRRGLEVLNRLRQDSKVEIEVADLDYAASREVDGKLVGLALDMQAAIMTTDYNLNRVAQIQGVPVLNVNELASSLKPVVIPGEGMTVRVVQEGKEFGQGVGFLDDGTMVVVESGSRFIDQDIEVLVTRVLQTAAGCIIFAQPRRG